MRLPCNEDTYGQFIDADDLIEIAAGGEFQAAVALAEERKRRAAAVALAPPVWAQQVLPAGAVKGPPLPPATTTSGFHTQTIIADDLADLEALTRDMMQANDAARYGDSRQRYYDLHAQALKEQQHALNAAEFERRQREAVDTRRKAIWADWRKGQKL